MDATVLAGGYLTGMLVTALFLGATDVVPGNGLRKDGPDYALIGGMSILWPITWAIGGVACIAKLANWCRGRDRRIKL